ncbi:hypothetical protein TNCV_1729221 [Trichonephila clavipes]|nr:hypothetical protein TNCV_1729221 [Trichonephila clavipes]
MCGVLRKLRRNYAQPGSTEFIKNAQRTVPVVFEKNAKNKATYPANKKAKEEVVCAGLNRNVEQSLQHVGVHYPAERYLQNLKRQLSANQLAKLCSHEPISDAAVYDLP